MIAALALVVLFQSDKLVTFTELAAPLKRLMPRLAEACQSPVKVSKAMENEVVCIAVHDVPVQELLNKVATATGGKWVTDRDGTWLKPDAAARAALTEKGIQKRTKRIEHDMSLTDIHAANEKWTLQAVPGEMGQDFAMQMTSLHRLESAVGARSLAEMSPGERIVFSTAPTSRQQPIAGDISAEIAGYAIAHDELISKSESGGTANTESGGTANSIKARLIAGKASRVNVIAECGVSPETAGMPQLTLSWTQFDSRGKAISYSVAIYIPNDVQFEPPLGGSTNLKPAEPPMEISKRAKLLRDFFSFDDRHQTPPVRSNALQLLVEPVTVDPLAYPAELLVAAAKARNCQLVASLPDDFMDWFSPQVTIDTPTAMFAEIERDSYLVSEQSASWLTISPTDFTHEPIDRAELTRIAAKYVAKYDITLDDLLDLAKEGFGVENGNDLVDRWLKAVNPMLETLENDEDWRFLRALAAFPPDQLQRLLSSKTISVGDVGIDARPLVESMVYGNTKIVCLEIDQQDGSHFWTQSDYRTEPTEVVPNGLPDAGPITVKDESDPIMRPAGQGDYTAEQIGGMAGFTPGEVGWQAAIRTPDTENFRLTSSGQLFTVSAEYDHEYSVFKSVQLGTRTTYTFRIYATSEAFHESKIVIPSFTSSTTYTLKTLPPALQKEFDESAKDTKDETKKDVEQYEKTRKTPPGL